MSDVNEKVSRYRWLRGVVVVCLGTGLFASGYVLGTEALHDAYNTGTVTCQREHLASMRRHLGRAESWSYNGVRYFPVRPREGVYEVSVEEGR